MELLNAAHTTIGRTRNDLLAIMHARWLVEYNYQRDISQDYENKQRSDRDNAREALTAARRKLERIEDLMMEEDE